MLPNTFHFEHFEWNSYVNTELYIKMRNGSEWIDIVEMEFKKGDSIEAT